MAFFLMMILAATVSHADTTYHDQVTKPLHTIYGGPGNDTIMGKTDENMLYGGPGADVFLVDLTNPSVDTLKDFNPSEGDQILLYLGDSAIIRDLLLIPRKLDLGNVQIDYKGNVKILLNNNTWLPFLKLNRSDLHMKVEDKSKNVRLIFKKTF